MCGNRPAGSARSERQIRGEATVGVGMRQPLAFRTCVRAATARLAQQDVGGLGGRNHHPAVVAKGLLMIQAEGVSSRSAGGPSGSIKNVSSTARLLVDCRIQ